MYQKLMVGILAAATVAAQTAPDRMRVNLTSEISTSLNRAGDKVTAEVIDATGASSYVTGTLKECQRKSGVASQTAVLAIEFDKWHVEGKQIAIAGTVVAWQYGDDSGGEADSSGRMKEGRNHTRAAVGAARTAIDIWRRGGGRPSVKTTAIVAGSGFAVGLVAGRFTSDQPDITMPVNTTLVVKTN